MKVPLEFYELLRSRINLSDVVRSKIVLAKKSGNYIGLCPFHKEKTPSFTVSDSKKFYYCFGCAASGDVIKFNAQINGLSYQQSAISLAGNYGIEIPKLTIEQKRIYDESDEISRILELANKFFQSNLSSENFTYLNNRGLNNKLIKEFELGFAPHGAKLQHFFEKKSIPLMMLEKAGLVGKREDGRMYELFYDRITFPIKNIYNKVIGFGGRTLSDGMPKYLNSPETVIFQKSEILYAENKAISTIYKKNYSILVEGYLDVINLHQAGFTETLACLGTSVSEHHLQKLWRAGDEVIICFDGDKAGIKANIRLINLALPVISSNKKISFIQLPADCDPDDIIRKNGAKFFNELLENRISLSEMIWKLEYEGKVFKTAEDKAVLEKNFQDYCFSIKDKTLKNSYVQFFKNQIWENVTKHKYKIKIQSSKILPVSNNYSEIETLEYAFCAILVKLPKLLENDNVKDFILTLHFQNNILADFRDWYFEEIINNNILDLDVIKTIVERTRFFDTFLILLDSNNQFLDISCNNKNNGPGLFWEWLYKKYYLILLKNEYAHIIKDGDDDAFKKATLYHKEILQLSKELQSLNESFIN